MRAGAVVVLRQGGLDLRFRPPEALELEVDLREGNVRFRVLRRQGPRLSDGGDGVVVHLLPGVGDAESRVGGAEVGSHRDRLEEEVDGVPGTIPAQVEVAEVRVGVGEGDVDLERLAILLLGLVVVALHLEQPAEAVEGGGVPRLQLEGTKVLGAGLGRVALFQTGVAEGQMRLHVVGLQVEGDPEGLDRLSVPPVGDQGQPEVVERHERIEIEVDDLLERLDRVLVLAFLVEAHPLGLQLERGRARIARRDRVGRRGRGGARQERPDDEDAKRAGGDGLAETHQYALSSRSARARSSTWGRIRSSRPGS